MVLVAAMPEQRTADTGHKDQAAGTTASVETPLFSMPSMWEEQLCLTSCSGHKIDDHVP